MIQDIDEFVNRMEATPVGPDGYCYCECTCTYNVEANNMKTMNATGWYM